MTANKTLLSISIHYNNNKITFVNIVQVNKKKIFENLVEITNNLNSHIKHNMKTKISRQNICFTVPGCPHANWKFIIQNYRKIIQQQIRLIHL